jgi:Family of unknown function (DUF6086)
MSYVFEWNDETLWSPALRVGKLYVTLADALAAMLSVPHGLSAMASDYYEVDRDRFAAFIGALRALSPEGHVVGRELLSGFLTTSLVLLRRMDAAPELDAEARTATMDFARSMAV